MSELATNALTHALTPFTVTLAAVAQSLLVKVRDGSPCHPVSVDGTPLDTAGRGVTIVALLSRDWGVTAHADGGKTVWAAFDTRQGLDPTLVRPDPSRSRTTSMSKPRRSFWQGSLPAPKPILSVPVRLGATRRTSTPLRLVTGLHSWCTAPPPARASASATTAQAAETGTRGLTGSPRTAARVASKFGTHLGDANDMHQGPTRAGPIGRP